MKAEGRRRTLSHLNRFGIGAGGRSCGRAGMVSDASGMGGGGFASSCGVRVNVDWANGGGIWEERTLMIGDLEYDEPMIPFCGWKRKRAHTRPGPRVADAGGKMTTGTAVQSFRMVAEIVYHLDCLMVQKICVIVLCLAVNTLSDFQPRLSKLPLGLSKLLSHPNNLSYTIWLPVLVVQTVTLAVLTNIARCTAKAGFVRRSKCKNIVRPESRAYA